MVFVGVKSRTTISLLTDAEQFPDGSALRVLGDVGVLEELIYRHFSHTARGKLCRVGVGRFDEPLERRVLRDVVVAIECVVEILQFVQIDIRDVVTALRKLSSDFIEDAAQFRCAGDVARQAASQEASLSIENVLGGAFHFESGGTPKAVNSKSGATVLMQFLPDIARMVGTTVS